jgi:hypothetical protein
MLGQILHVCPQTICNWHRAGQLPVRVSEGRIIRFNIPEVLAELAGMERGHTRSSLPAKLCLKIQKLSNQILDHIDDRHNVMDPEKEKILGFVKTRSLADYLNTTAQTVTTWDRIGLISGIHVRETVRFDFEGVVTHLATRAAAKRAALQKRVRPAQENTPTQSGASTSRLYVYQISLIA